MSIIGSNIIAGASGQATGYNLNNSLRFRRSATAYLSKTLTTPTNNKIWTWSSWVKIGILGDGTNRNLIRTSSGATTGMRFETSDTIRIFFEDAGAGDLQTTQLFRDPSAWYHIVLTVDTTQATAANRVKLYINGTQVTAFSTSTYPTQNYNTQINSAIAHTIGSYNTIELFDGYMTEINFVDGQALTPSSFGETSLTTGSWIPKKYTGTYGNNGFYLNFSDTSAATAAAIGKDSSGNGNNWTPSGISVTAGVTYDAMLDVPTNTSATVGNYPTLNPLNPFKPYVTLSNANLTATGNTAVNTDTVYSTMGSLSTSIYWEYTCVTVGSSYGRTGAITIFPTAGGGVPGEAPLGGFCWRQDGYLVTPSGSSLVLPTFTTNDVLGYALNPTAGTCALYKNGSLVYTVSGLSTTSTFFPATAEYNGSVGAYNFGQRPFIYTPPSGFVALNTFNLPSSTIPQGNKYMDATTYTGTGATATITNAASFKPDLVWVKCRSHGTGHLLEDTVRGVLQYIGSESTGAESTLAGSITSFNSNGFSVGTQTGTNSSGRTFVGWQWQAGQGTNTSNTSGSITSTVSVSTTAGFSVVTYTGTGANATVGHGLGVAPSIIICKPRSAVDGWMSYHSALGNTKYIMLNTTAAAAVGSGAWNNTSPTSSVFSIGTSGNVNTNGVTMVAYCWAEIAGFSAFGSYTGNGSANGPFVFTGFRPKFVMMKCTTAGAVWTIIDSTRDTYNASIYKLAPNSTGEENNITDFGSPTTVNQIDILSNGFKQRGTDGNQNANGQTYIYMAFAANPFKNSNAF